jgi:2-keto-4-pentenoate hydratase/2-oxohepta-3-ene-1,7-dioic acid hydratase in catechol pathway
MAAPGHYLILEGSGERISVGKIVCIGRNYADHVKEMGAPRSGPPVIFLKPPSSIVHDGGQVILPAGFGVVHHEVELVVAIDKPGKRIPEERALDHVLGYAVGLDMTLRDLQSRAKERGTPWSLAKGFDSSAPLSPVVAAAAVGDGSGLKITLDVNGERRQEADTSQMLRSVAELVAHGSRLMTLERGDLLYTGTPAGVGPVEAGDLMVATIEKVGSLTVTVAAEH